MSSSASILKSLLCVCLNELELYPAAGVHGDGTLEPIRFELFRRAPARWQAAARNG
jgi:hypothetical protein